MLCAAALVFAAHAACAQSAPPEAVKELAPTGTLRAAINYGNGVLAQKGADGSRRAFPPICRASSPSASACRSNSSPSRPPARRSRPRRRTPIDVLFVAIEPVRAADVEFSPPYVLIEGTYMVLKDSPLKEVGDVDRAGMRVAIGRGSAYDLYLTRTLKNATLVRAATGGCCAMIDLFRAEKLDAVAGVRQPLVEYAKSHADVRVMDGRFQEIRQAMGTPKGRPAAVAYLRALHRGHEGEAASSPTRSNAATSRTRRSRRAERIRTSE